MIIFGPLFKKHPLVSTLVKQKLAKIEKFDKVKKKALFLYFFYKNIHLLYHVKFSPYDILKIKF